MRRHFVIHVALTLGLTVLVCLPNAGRAETVKLKDGRTLEGRVLAVGGGLVIIERNATQIVLPESSVIPPDIDASYREAKRYFDRGDMARAEEICHHILLWRSRDQKTSQLMSRIKKAEADALAKNQADAKACEDRLKQAKQATNDGAFAKARGLCNRVLAEDPENDEAMDLLPEIDKAEAKARERAETDKQAREAKIDEAMQVLDQKDLARAVEISRAAVLQNPGDDKARALLQQIGKVAIERITELTTASLMSGNMTSKDLQALLAQANVLARDAGAGVSTATLSNMLTSLAVFVTPRQQEPPESIPPTSLTEEPSPFAPGTSPGVEPTPSPSVSNMLASPESLAKGATTGTIPSAALDSGVPAESSAATTTPTLRLPSQPKSTHDPMHAGYPDTPDKPESVKQAEQLIVKNWDYVLEVLPQITSEEHFAAFMKDIEAHNMRFQSDAAKQEYWRCQVAANTLAAVANHAQAEGQISNAKELRSEFSKYLMEDYLEKTRGIRLYNLKNPKDRDLLGAGAAK